MDPAAQSPSPRLRLVLLADDNAQVRSAIRLLAEQIDGLQVVGEAVDVAGLVEETSALAPDLVLIDWGLPGLAGSDVLAHLREAHPDVTLVVLSGLPEVRQAALAAGAHAFVSESDPPESLVAVLETLRAQEP